jgi:protein O-mannosyl-transferase
VRPLAQNCVDAARSPLTPFAIEIPNPEFAVWPTREDASTGDLRGHRLLGWMLPAGILALTLGVYWQVCHIGFIIFDDSAYVTENRHVLAGLNLNGIRWAFTTVHDANWIPMTWISLMIDTSLFGSRPAGYHITNLVLHLTNVLLVLALFHRLTGNLGRSAFVAALFAVHPLHVESVAWIAERKDVLSLFFGLLSLNAYTVYTQRSRRTILFVAWLLFVLSLFTKQTPVTLPFVLLLLDFAPLGRMAVAGTRRLLIEKLPFLITSAAFCAIAVWAQSRAVRSLTAVPLASRLLNSIFAYGLYAWRAILPLNLAPFYPHPGTRLGPVEVLPVLAILLAITWFCAARARQRPLVLVGWLWYLGALVPMLGIVQVGGQQMADRYMYFPAIGLYAAVAWFVPDAFAIRPVPRWLQPVAATTLVAAMAGVATVQLGYWHDSVTLFRHALRVTDDNALSRLALGNALLERGECDEAIVHLKKAAELDPDDARAHFALGSGFQQADCPREAVAEYQRALALDELNGSAHNNLGLILYQQHRHAEARSEFLRAIELDETDARALVNLALLTSDLHEYENSVAYCQRALALDPGLDVCKRLIAVARDVPGRLAETSRNGGFN